MATTKRGLFALAAGAVASAGVVAAASGNPTPPVLMQPSAALCQLWREYRDVFNAWKACSESPGSLIRDRLVARHGDIKKIGRDYKVRVAAWKRDPDHPCLLQYIEKSDRLSNASAELFEAVLAFPSLSPADASFKLAVVAEYWRSDPESDDQVEYHERMARAAFREMQALIVPQLPPEMSPVGMV